ncbi:hypothetical protein CR162_11915 [Pseudoroseomonas rhizosphaerae]|uniref:TauD/TfdA-like domain-containing protein n=1 Tax=Teichococcus rhizosphaerae TaxID=1335062 RepID=A0A2C7AC22_9PROT|nr:hypothetical protein [Pseudoroseomonas rhizosphaerae]PHK94634.1 hypothetical protein CR162_11915 [Pseudoroseomonas rhizosphaerae]
MTEPSPPRRIAPQTGPHLWLGSSLSPADWMLPLGGGIAAEIEAALAIPGTPLTRLDPLLAQLAERLAHGLGFALLRGLPLPAGPAALLGLLGSRMGRAVHAPLPAGPAAGPWHTEPCDALLLLCREAVEVTLLSAAALHNALLKNDRAALEVLYRPLPHALPSARPGAPPAGPEPGGAQGAVPPGEQGGEREDRGEEAPEEADLSPGVAEGSLPVFAVTGGVFAARCDRAALDERACGGALAALDDAAATPGLALRLPLRPGDLLCVNPFLVWASRMPGLSALPLVMPSSRLSDGPFMALRDAEA